MPSSGYTRFIPYLLVVAVLVLVGFNSLKGEGGDSASGASFGNAGASTGDGSGSVTTPGTADASDMGAAGSSDGLAISSSTQALVVDVAGGVMRPGVYRLPPGSRVIDAIKKAGGITARGLPGSINRAAKLADGQQVVVPEAVAVAGGSGASGPGAASASSGAASSAAAGAAVAGSSAGAGTAAPISLGSATAEQLEQIDGIGPVTAADIIEYRDSKGGLSSVDQLDQVSGIGPVTMEALRSSLQP